MKNFKIFNLVIGAVCGFCTLYNNAFCSDNNISSDTISKYFLDTKASNSTLNFQNGQKFLLNLHDLKEEFKIWKEKLEVELNKLDTKNTFFINKDNNIEFYRTLEKLDNEFMNICTSLCKKYENTRNNLNKNNHDLIKLLDNHMMLSSTANNYYEEYIKINKNNKFVHIKEDIPNELINEFVEFMNRENDKQFYLFGKELEQEYKTFKEIKYITSNDQFQKDESNSKFQEITEIMKNIESQNLELKEFRNKLSNCEQSKNKNNKTSYDIDLSHVNNCTKKICINGKIFNVSTEDMLKYRVLEFFDVYKTHQLESYQYDNNYIKNIENEFIQDLKVARTHNDKNIMHIFYEIRKYILQKSTSKLK